MFTYAARPPHDFRWTTLTASLPRRVRIRVPDQTPVQVLCVCTGNLCRSPVAERLLAARLGDTVEVTSAGTFGVVGEPIAPPMASRLARMGIDPADFAARRMVAATVRSADLILAMTREHRGEVVELYPAAVQRSFTLLEFARLLATIDPSSLPAGTPADRLRSAVSMAARRRHRSTTNEDVDDPFGRPDSAYQRAFDEIDRAILAVAEVINPDPFG